MEIVPPPPFAKRILPIILLSGVVLQAPFFARWVSHASFTDFGSILALLVLAAQTKNWREAIHESPNGHWLLFAAALTAFGILQRTLVGTRSLDEIATVFTGWALLQAFCQFDWRRTLPVALLIVSTLGAMQHVEFFLGGPLRMVTGEMAAAILRQLGLAVVSSAEVLQFESGVAYVDVACSGLRSLTLAAQLFLLVTIEGKRRVGLWWLALGTSMALLLVVGNTLRIAILAWLGLGLRFTTLADVVHVPFGILNFIVAIGFVLFFIQRKVAQPGSPNANCSAILDKETRQEGRQNVRWPVALALTLVVLGVMGQTRRESRAKVLVLQPIPRVNLPFFSSVPLSSEEKRFFSGLAGDAVKYRFTGDVSGSVVLVVSTDPRAHHPPELCHATAGRKLLSAKPYSRRQRLLLGSASKKHPLQSALYWFQSAEHQTPSLAKRYLLEFQSARQRWVMASVLYDDVPDDEALDASLMRIDTLVAQYLSAASSDAQNPSLLEQKPAQSSSTSRGTSNESNE